MPRSPLARLASAGTPLAGLAALLLAPRRAHADLTADADRLAQQWALRGAQVERLAPLFLDRGRAKTVVTARPASAPAPPQDERCLTVAFLSVRTAELALAAAYDKPDDALPGKPQEALPFPPRSAPPDGDRRTRSAGGAVMIERCGAARDELRRVTVEVTSSRAAVEVLVARSPRPLGEIREALPERAAGPVAPRGDPGGFIEPGPIEGRLARAEKRAQSDGAARVTRASMRAGPSGSGEFHVHLVEGCHRLELMAEVPHVVPRRATDLDADARTQDGRLLARDRADVPDARLDVCVGETTLVEIPFAGASGAVNVAFSDAHWPAPREIPATWGPRARAGIFGALLRRHAPTPAAAPIREALGVQGMTQIPIEVEPGRCYLAAVGLVRGDARAIRLSTRIGDRTARDEGGERAEGAALAFCADVEDTATIEVDARGNAPWWALELWPMGVAAP